MKQFFLLLLTGSITCTAIAQSKDETPFITKSLSGAGITSVEAQTTGGNITVTGVPDGEAKVDVFLRDNNGRLPNGTKEELQQRLDEDYTFTLTADNHKLVVTAKRKSNNWNSKRDFSISFRIYVPQKVSAKLATSGGNVSLSHLSGALEFATSGGNLQLEDLAGSIKGMTSGGNIHVNNVRDDVKLTTSGGNIHASKSNGKLTLSTSGGNVHLNDLDGKIDATTSGGNVDGSNISGDLTASTSGGNVAFDKLSCTLSAFTSGGHLSVKLIALGTYVKLGNSGGNIDLQLPANKGLDLKLSGEKVKVNALTNFNGKVDDNHVEGSLNGGGVPVIVTGRSSKVSVTLL